MIRCEDFTYMGDNTDQLLAMSYITKIVRTSHDVGYVHLLASSYFGFQPDELNPRDMLPPKCFFGVPIEDRASNRQIRKHNIYIHVRMSEEELFEAYLLGKCTIRYVFADKRKRESGKVTTNLYSKRFLYNYRIRKIPSEIGGMKL